MPSILELTPIIQNGRVLRLSRHPMHQAPGKSYAAAPMRPHVAASHFSYSSGVVPSVSRMSR